jgi:DeoR family transcriptional regulator, fructose operon transcriptional repressor
VFPHERQQEILRLARANGRVDVVALAEELDVTTETVRRDLTLLERAGVLRRVHGGAIPVERLGFEPALAARDAVMVAEKERIAKAALAEVPDEGVILLDAGSTTTRLADVLPTNRDLTVVVNSPPLATRLAAGAHLSVIILGGRVRGRTLAAVDDWGWHPLRQMCIDVAFVATNGFSFEHGLTTPDPAEAAMKREMISAAKRVVLVADHTKFGNDYFACFGALADVDVLVTDSGLDESLAADIAGAGPTVIRA